ncbi:50S ribosomal protein L35 [Candidatus Peregrinibacteria bacterium CG10_big_fil_rev_8_21_14_0_10_55_24]|nr:MAG: 50S ribosomal protein L35 [Candidatus Peregrinibacteria bacterium CG10_big_fil_rev_8_21_14_0_10_55_24]
MPKLKSHSGAKKRVRRTGSGRLAVRRAGRNHLLLQKSKRQKKLNRTLLPSATERRSIETLLPYL